MKELEGKIALVTGASRGLGRGVAMVLAEKGATVVVNFRSGADATAETVAAIEKEGGTAVAMQADVSESGEVGKLFDRIAGTFGRLDILVNNAGTSRAQDIFQMSEADWDFILKTNLKSVFLCSKRAMEMMREQNFGRIISMTSMVAYRGAVFGHCHYAATKGAILSFTRACRDRSARAGQAARCGAGGGFSRGRGGQLHHRSLHRRQRRNVLPLGVAGNGQPGLSYSSWSTFQREGSSPVPMPGAAARYPSRSLPSLSLTIRLKRNPVPAISRVMPSAAKGRSAS